MRMLFSRLLLYKTMSSNLACLLHTPLAVQNNVKCSRLPVTHTSFLMLGVKGLGLYCLRNKKEAVDSGYASCDAWPHFQQPVPLILTYKSHMKIKPVGHFRTRSLILSVHFDVLYILERASLRWRKHYFKVTAVSNSYVLIYVETL